MADNGRNAATATPRFLRIAQVLRNEMGRLYGMAVEQVDPEQTFLALGADSLLLLRASRFVRDTFGVRVPFRRLLDELGTVHALAAHLDRELPAEPAPASAPAASASAPPADASPAPVPAPPAAASAPPAALPAPAPAAGPAAAPAPAGTGVLERIVAQQLQVMQEQLAALRAHRAAPDAAAPSSSSSSSSSAAIAPAASAAPIESAEIAAPASIPTADTAVPPSAAAAAASGAASEADGADAPRAAAPSHAAGYDPAEDAPLDARRSAHVQALVARLDARLAGSRSRAEAGRETVAYPAAVRGFRRAWKDAVYPLAVERAAGARFTDVDGNEYVDLELDRGALVLGHAPVAVAAAVRAELERGTALGAPRLASEAAALLCRLTGTERAAWLPSRDEAVSAALRMARAATERDGVALFAGADHGAADGVLARRTPLGDGARGVPAAPGIPAGAAAGVLVLAPGEGALQTLRARGAELAAVLVHPAFLSPDELRAVAAVCVDTGAALVVDETDTLPRLHPGGAARLHGIDADLLVVGGAVAAGAPVAAVAGRAAYLDTADGGPWSFGDGSYPRVDATRLPGDGHAPALGVAAAHAVLSHLEQSGPALQPDFAAKAEALAAALRDAFGGAPVSVRAAGGGVIVEGDADDLAVLRLHLRARGVHVGGGAWHLSTAHTADDAARVAEAVADAVEEMRQGGFLGAADADPAEHSASAETAEATSGAESSAAAVEAEAETQTETLELPLTAAQRELWLLSSISEEGARAYNEPTALRVRGPFYPQAMQAAVAALVARHQALRTRIGAGGEAQYVEPRVDVDVPLVDLSHLPEDEAQAGLRDAIAQEVDTVFDLARAPLFRARILRLAHDDHALVYTLHHAVTDGWSNGLLLNELRALYEAGVAGHAPALRPAGRYADAVRARAAGGEAEAASLAHWKRELAAPPVLELPTDRARPAAQSFSGGRERHPLDPALVRRLAALGEARGSTFFGVLLAGFQLFLHRLTGQDDVVVGAITAGQVWDGAATVGYFTDLLPLRSRLAGNPAFADFLGDAHGRFLDALEHRGLPVSRLVEALEIARDPSRPPLASVSLTWQRSSDGALRLGEAVAERMEVRTGVSRFDLAVVAVESENGTRLECEYNTDLFDRDTVLRWLRHLETLLSAAAAAPDAPVLSLPLLSAGEERQVLEAWNASGPAAEGIVLHGEFERQAARTPDAVAVETDDERLTYAHVEARANRLAHALRRAGVGPDAVVGLCVERSAQMVAGMLGILKAGGAWLPLDPTLPADRLRFMLDDARPRAVLAQESVAGALPTLDVPVLRIGEAWDDEELPDTPAGVSTSPAHLAYVLYTSGSTGRPKGVMIPHRGICNRVAWVRDTYPMDDSDAVLFKTPYTFDASVWEVFLPLWTGGRVVVARPGGHQDPAYLVEAMARHGVTTLQLVPSMLQVLSVQPGLEACATLRRLSCGGEAYPAALARAVARRLPGVALVNLYGPTEASIDVASWRFRGDEAGALLPIGRPVSGTRIYLLDDGLRPVPPGAAGELYADGPGLARGYLGRPGMTAERFVPDPYAHVPGSRMYRTGDRARWRADGALEFLGRADDQVKVRGFRIELGEIEAALASHEAVGAAVAAVRETAGGAALVAYVVAANGHPPVAAELREHLRRRLPDYMVPAAFVTLDELPRMPGGKVDRRALPAPRAAGFAAREGYVPPRSATEGVLADIWGEVLKSGPVGVHDRFFDLGGHSLSVLQLLGRIRAVLGVEVPLRVLFDDPTVAGLAVAVERLRGEDADAPAVPPLVARGGDGPLPLSFAQQRLWLLHQLEPRSPAYNLYSAFPFPAGAEPAALRAALTALVERHASLRTVFPEGDGTGVQRVLPAAPVPLSVADFSEVTDREARWEAARAASRDEVLRPFDLAAGPLLRATLVRLGEDGDRLVLVMHHVVTDGWSMDVIRDDLAVLYDAAVRGEPAPLAPLPVSYGDYARWEREWLSGEVLEAQLAYWRERLAGMPPVVSLPTDRPRPGVQTYRGDTRAVRLPAALAAGVRKLAGQAQATLFMTVLAAFKTLLHRHGAGSDIVVGTHVANRDRVEVERLVGFFVNALVLRTDLSGDPTFRQVVERVRDTALGAFSHAHLSFERLVEEMQPVRDLSLSPLYQVSFDYQRVAGGGAGGGPALLRSAPATKFDLEVTALEVGDELQVHVSFSTDLYDTSTIEGLLRRFERLLASAVATPRRPISTLSILDEAETARLTGELQGPRRGYPVHQTLDRLIAERAARVPGEVAVVHGGDALTYAELDARSTRLARVLRGMGAGRGARVGILDERGIDFVASVVAVLKSGAAYVPFDPTYPAPRVRHMLADSGVRVLVSRAGLAAGVAGALAAAPALAGVVLLDDDAPALSDALPALRVVPRAEVDGESAEPLDGPRTDPRDPAYMLYTSGSTGLPKGAVVRHDGAVNHVFAEAELLGLDGSLRFLQSAPASSDISVWQMLAPLVLGGRSVVADAETVSDPERLFAVLRDEGVTLFEPVPAVMRALLEHAAALPEDARALPALRHAMATGEAVPAELVNAWLAAYPAVPVVNAYGPTEASDDVTQLEITAPLPAEARTTSIGRPLPNLDCRVVDASMGLVPVGVPGELCIGGIAVGDGYPGHPGKTAAAFVPDPFSGTPGALLYRTGDRVRWRADGTLDFMGRTDQQVKVRGFRIEPGEVESALMEHASVAGCAVVARAGELAAYLVAADGAPDPAALRGHLRERLPEHMVPTVFVAVDALPLTPAGKVDRRALAADRTGALEPAEAYAAPRTPTEEALAAIWAEVLKRERVSVEADFFALGGHSLLAAMVAARVRRALEVELPLRRVFEHTTVATLAAHVDHLRAQGTHSTLPRLGRAPRSGRRLGEVAEGVLKTV
ncbi:MAG TPA: amino acid adenylation domain-containing protein [Longimicrobium sp.]|jgi:amino acid adenylation domain-containing protein|uniref:amino acid adenylation domain-containing protein n=1 Tax=Longimicrobium sp. TaxID=2029185 RepID=UPI002ED86FAB